MRSAKRPSNRKRPLPMRLRLECLEGREVPATIFTVTTTQDVVDPADGKVSLREAVTRANNHAGVDTIVLPPGVFTITPAAFEDGNLMGDLDITDSVTVRGAGAGKTVIDGRQHDRLFDIRGVAPSSMRVVLQGLTVRNGFVIGDGAGIRVGNADLLVRDCVVSGNRASLTGGGISNAAAPGTGNVTLIRTTVVRNSSGGSGGGINVTGNSTLTLRDSIVRRNFANSSGGGIQASTATVTNSTVSGNKARFSGGGFAITTATLSGSTVSGNTARNQGGGISSLTLNVTSSTVSGNTSELSAGGGISASTANVTHSTVSGNSAAGGGGGIDANTANVTNSTVSGNSGGLAEGGGIAAAIANVTNSTVSGNSAAGGGGGGGIAAGTANVNNSTVSGNSAAGGNGGGIRAGSTANVTNSTVSGNSAAGGGGIAADRANVTNSTVSGNTASDRGGGITAFEATLVNVTVTDNMANRGGGVCHDPLGVFRLRNTIVAQNLVDFNGTAQDVSGDFVSLGHNLIGDPSGGTGFGVNGDLVGTAEDPLDPRLGPLANNGGPTRTHALLPGSPAIDHGDNSLSATDQRGRARLKDGDANGSRIVDIGAFER